MTPPADGNGGWDKPGAHPGSDVLAQKAIVYNAKRPR
jgi:hypothetical protein